MANGDLVSMAEVKAYLGGDLQSNDDAVLGRLISAASAFFVTGTDDGAMGHAPADDLLDAALNHRPACGAEHHLTDGR